MNTNFTIKNFRVFDENGVNIDLKPITILTGCNSSGKSSIVKSLLLLTDYLSQLKQDAENEKKISLVEHKLDFAKKPNNSLGKFSRVLNRNSSNDAISLGIRVHSQLLGQDVNLDFSFAGLEADSNTHGYITSIEVSKLDGNVIFRSTVDKSLEGNYYCVFQDFLRFAYTQHYIHMFQAIESNRLVGFDDNIMGDEEFSEFCNGLKAYLNEYKEIYGRDSLIDVIKWNRSHNWSFLDKHTHDNATIIEKVKEYGCLYFLPILEKLKDLSKNECVLFIKENVLDFSSEDAKTSIVRRMINDFVKSEYESFLPYYISWEKAHLSSIHKNFGTGDGKKSPKLPTESDTVLRCSSIIMSPQYSETIDSFSFLGDDNEFVDSTIKSKEEEIQNWECQSLSFEMIFEALAILSNNVCPDDYLYYSTPSRFVLEYNSKTDAAFHAFVSEVIMEIVTETAYTDLSYVGSSIINVKRLYPLESSDEFTELLKRYFNAKRNLDKKSTYIPDTFINKWIKAFGIGDSITADVDEEGLGVTLRLHDCSNDKKGSMLAESGYGVTQLYAILLSIEVSILERKVSEVPSREGNIYPCMTENKIEYSTKHIAIEEPEIHLHPRYQSLLADMFVEAYSEYGVQFILETHSEYLIRKLQTLVANGSVSANMVSLLYVYDTHNRPTHEPQVKKINIKKDGRLAESFGSGFFDEADSLAEDLLNIKLNTNG